MNKKEVLGVKQFFLKLVRIMTKNNNYADVLLIKENSLTISKDNVDINIDNGMDFGVKLRLFDGEQFHVFGMSGLDKPRLEKEAVKLSKIKALNKIRLNICKKKINKHFLVKGKLDPGKISIRKKAETVNKLQKQILGGKIINARVLYMEEQELKIFVNQYKQLSQNINSCFLMTLPFIKAIDGNTRYNYKSFFSSGYEVTKIPLQKIKKLINTTYKIAKAKKLTPGKYTCILSPHLSGLLAHESFGHGMESDTLYKDRAKAKEFLGKQIAPKFVSIIDNPAFPARNGSFFFDDEGVMASPTYLIKKGIVKAPITDMYSASRLCMEGINVKRSANARAESYDHKSYARMSNTYFAPGKAKLSKMIKSIKDGLYLHNSSGGMEDPKGWHVQIQGVVAEKIKNGKLTGELFYEIGMTGYLPTILKNIKAVSDKLIVPGTGRCGKGHKEWVRVSEGGPHLLIKEVDLA
ncbi:TldD/PmbA family protein [Candidatus Woesearchaeota archaeon]|nr:TldD/PmbA family protein [Candidatus Woesearchaeota archaeon]MBT5271870.1 TldD/PmbA family protein [Candidatus Woesearchaeota archaeon]MBT6041666.1 TldD/PmbA family protein [Candidatus Woesearchaeota archaeon]MBT6337358.1 TldD/PmbA family protein [Candidatus Woesearchaeota archaeon]MBT7927606.1 TldD/PmbA family protein [Candidatus Woesearchaeota archaeon]